MVLQALKEIKERGIKNVIEENIELAKELGLLGYLKVKTESMKEGVLGKAEAMRNVVIGKEKIGTRSETTKTFEETEKEYPPAPEEVERKVSSEFKTGM